MKILLGNQIAQADRQTIEREGISSLDLMERASERLAEYLCANLAPTTPLCFVIGKGNNGGDGLAMARIMHSQGFVCKVFIPKYEGKASDEMSENLSRLPAQIERLVSIKNLGADELIIDALLGSGLRGAVREYYTHVISQINDLPNKKISIDIPSGLDTEFNASKDDESLVAVHADKTLSIQFPKLAMMFSEAGNLCGEIEIIDIGLDSSGIECAYSYTTSEQIKQITKKAQKFDYKNVNGHALLICGSRTMMGAARLAAFAALRSGVGLASCHIPFEERLAMQLSCPSAMLSLDESSDCFSSVPEKLDKYSSILIGCGLGTDDKSAKALRKLLSSFRGRMVLDADALNLISKEKDMLQLIPEGSILTPHLGELRRFFSWQNTEELLLKTKEFAAQIKCYVTIKGAHTALVCPDGTISFNSSGSPAMAKAGSGDVLAGLMAGLLAQSYSSKNAALIAIYQHGKAGEKAAKIRGILSCNSLDIASSISL